MTKKEIWVDLIYSPNKYEMSDLGNVRQKKTKKPIKAHVNPQGYLTVTIFLENKGKWQPINIHRVLYFSFNPGTSEKLHIHHLDENKLNNKLSNLSPIDHRIHAYVHAIKNGTRPPINRVYGKNNFNWKGRIISLDLKTNQIMHIFTGTTQITKAGFLIGNVYHVINGRRKKHRNLFFTRIADDLNVEIGQIFNKI
jgi:hypothetical protein